MCQLSSPYKISMRNPDEINSQKTKDNIVLAAKITIGLVCYKVKLVSI